MSINANFAKGSEIQSRVDPFVDEAGRKSNAFAPRLPQEAGRWYQHPFDQPLEAHDYHGLSYSNGNMAPCPPSYNWFNNLMEIPLVTAEEHQQQ